MLLSILASQLMAAEPDQANSPLHQTFSFWRLPFLFPEVVAGENGEEGAPQPPPCCGADECRERANEGCRKQLACGHPCRGPGEGTCWFVPSVGHNTSKVPSVVWCLVSRCVALRQSSKLPIHLAHLSMIDPVVSRGRSGGAECLPCIETDCPSAELDGNDFCNVCWTESLLAAPCVKVCVLTVNRG